MQKMLKDLKHLYIVLARLSQVGVIVICRAKAAVDLANGLLALTFKHR